MRKASWKRRLSRHAPVALLCGFAVFVILNIAAWYNLRDEWKVCRRQGYTRITLQSLQHEVESYRKEHGEPPKSLSDIPDINGSFFNRDLAFAADEWENPIRYRTNGETFELSSYGRDGQPGGVGLDADLFHDERNQELSLPTFRQYFGETDKAEVDRGGFVYAGILAGIMVAFITFSSLGDVDINDEGFRFIHFLVSGLVIVCLASLVGVFLLPVHIPSGH